MPAGRLTRLLTPLLLVAGLLSGPAPAQGLDPGRAPGQDAATPPVAAREYTLAITPLMPAAEMKRRWQPVLDEIARSAGLRFRFRFYEDQARFDRGLAEGAVDFAVAGPVVIWQQRQHYAPLLRGNLSLRGLVVVRQDSPLQDIVDLQERTLAMKAGSAIISSMPALRALWDKKSRYRLHLANTDSSALRSVIVGRSDAAAVDNYVLKLAAPDVIRQLRILHQAPDLPPPAILGNRRCPTEVLRRFRDAVLGMRERQPAMLESIVMPDVVEADLERDYGVMATVLATAPGDHP